MNPELTAKLTRLKNFRTRYELAATDGTTKVLVGYTARKGRIGLLGMLRQNGEAFVAFAGAETFDWGKKVADGATVGAWKITFTGRTQRDAFIEGELPWFKDALPVAA